MKLGTLITAFGICCFIFYSLYKRFPEQMKKPRSEAAFISLFLLGGAWLNTLLWVMRAW